MYVSFCNFSDQASNLVQVWGAKPLLGGLIACSLAQPATVGGH